MCSSKVRADTQIGLFYPNNHLGLGFILHSGRDQILMGSLDLKKPALFPLYQSKKGQRWQ